MSIKDPSHRSSLWDRSHYEDDAPVPTAAPAPPVPEPEPAKPAEPVKGKK